MLWRLIGWLKWFVRTLLNDEDHDYEVRGNTRLMKHDWKHITCSERFIAVPIGSELLTTTSTIPIVEFWAKEHCSKTMPSAWKGEVLLSFHQYAGHTSETNYLLRFLRFWAWVIVMYQMGVSPHLTWECVKLSNKVYQRNKRWINPF